MAQVITHPRRTWPTKQVEPIVVVAAAAVGEHPEEEEEVVFARTVVVAPSLTTDQNANCVSRKGTRCSTAGTGMMRKACSFLPFHPG